MRPSASELLGSETDAQGDKLYYYHTLGCSRTGTARICTIELDFFKSRSRIPTFYLHAHGGVRHHKSRLSAWCALPAAEYECWAAALHICPRQAISQLQLTNQNPPQNPRAHKTEVHTQWGFWGNPNLIGKWSQFPIQKRNLRASCHSAHFLEVGGARQRTGCQNGWCPPFSVCYLMMDSLTVHVCFCLWVCTMKQSCQHKKTYQRDAEWQRKTRW